MSDVTLSYPVPWRFVREHAPRYGVRNASLERLRHVSFGLIGPGVIPMQVPITVEAGATAWIPIHGDDLARSTVLVVRWRRENGDEYLWRAVF